MAQVPTADEVKTLGELTSVSYRLSNRAWLAMMAVAVVVLIPRQPSDTVELPFGFGGVPTESFYSIVVIMLVAVTMGFAAAYAQAIRTHDLSRQLLDNLPVDAQAAPMQVHPQDLFDLQQYPTMNRVASLAQILRGQNQFMPAARNMHPAKLWLTTVYYVLLKLIATGFYFVVPGYALWKALGAATFAGGMQVLLWIGVGVAALALIEVMAWEIYHILQVALGGMGAKAGSDGT